jgi:hypothetical protein
MSGSIAVERAGARNERTAAQFLTARVQLASRPRQLPYFRAGIVSQGALRSCGGSHGREAVTATLKRGTYLINTARGRLVDRDAVLRAPVRNPTN